MLWLLWSKFSQYIIGFIIGAIILVAFTLWYHLTSSWYHLPTGIIYPMVSFTLWYHLPSGTIYPLVSFTLRYHLPSRIIYPLVSFALWYHLRSDIIYPLVSFTLWYHLPSGIIYPLVSFPSIDINLREYIFSENGRSTALRKWTLLLSSTYYHEIL